ncbi:MAG: cache domain-containing protein [Chloroflexota bacterium]
MNALRAVDGLGRLMNIRFAHKILIALLVVGLVPVAVVSLSSVQRTRDQLTQLAVDNIRQRSAATAAAIDAYLQNRLSDIVIVARLPEVLRHAQNVADPAIKASAREAMRAVAARAPEYESIAIVDPSGTILTATIASDEGTSVAFREYFLTAMKGTSYVSDPSYSVITNRPALFFSAPIRDASGKVLAVARTRVNLAAIWDIVEADAGSIGPGAHGFLVDDYGIRLAVSETKNRRDQALSFIYKPIASIEPEVVTRLAADRRFGQITPDKLVIDPLPALRSALDDLRSVSTTTSADFSFASAIGAQRGVVSRLGVKPWAYTLAVPISTYTRSADEATLDAAAMLGLGILLAIGIGAWLSRSLVRPLRRLVATAVDVSTGAVDLHIAQMDPTEGDDITREVASAFDRLLNALRYYVLLEQGTAIIPRETSIAVDRVEVRT